MAPESTCSTVGHGTLAADGFAALLAGAGIRVLVDVRRYAGSRRHPHFGGAEMTTWLPQHGIAYLALPALGGRRKPTDDQTNAAWRNPQFRAYADHMASEEFREGVGALKAAFGQGPTAVMCSESLWWRCHRRLLADHLQLVEGVGVHHLFHDGRTAPHAPTPEATVEGGRLVYPPA